MALIITVNVMMKIQKYFTGLEPLEDEPYQPGPPFKGAGWCATIESGKKRKYHPTKQEVCISSYTWTNAQRALKLICWCLNLYTGDPVVCDIDFIAYNNDEPKWENEVERISHMRSISIGNIPLACAIAAKASRDLRCVYAIAKYNFSISLYSAWSVDIDPFFATDHLAISQFPDDHVRFSYAIISAYSAIEDLGLEIRASKEKPSRINGEWNPIVKEELESRLRESNISLGDTLLWSARGSIRRVDRKRPIKTRKMEPWAWGPIRDREVDIIEAIAYAGWLRGKVASHSTKMDLTPSLSPYDVVNVQHLIRRLILEKLGFWRWEKKIGTKKNP